jgi:pimeloyl-ACP methyl ester carboxylesterase
MYYEFSGEGGPLVFISGLGSDHKSWKMAQVPYFTAAGYKCLLLDNRDVGQTDDSPVPIYTIKECAEDVSGLLHNLGIKQAHIIGASMGGRIAQELAINFPNLVRSLTLACTSAIAEPITQDRIASWKNAKIKFSLEEFYEMLGVWLFTYRFYENAEAVKLFKEVVRTNPYPQSSQSFLRQCDAVMGHNTLDRLSHIIAPM